MYEICLDPPYFLDMSTYMGPLPHQAIGFQPKHCCNVREVEFAQAYRMDMKEIELLSFTIPRVKVSI